MTKNQSLLLRVLLFFAGAGVIALAFFLKTGDHGLTRTDAFFWTSISLMYLIFFFPFFFSAINIDNFSGKIPALSLVWFSIFLYIAASITVIILLLTALVISLTTAVIIQTVLLSLFFVNVYFAYIAVDHVRAFAAEEAGKQQYLAQIKSKARVLQLSIERFQPESAKNIITRALDDIKYIYPVNSGAGSDLELKILGSLDTLSELAGSVGVNPAVQESEAVNLQALVNERKLLRN
jgi:low affinity Fe/Cu permease